MNDVIGEAYKIYIPVKKRNSRKQDEKSYTHSKPSFHKKKKAFLFVSMQAFEAIAWPVFLWKTSRSTRIQMENKLLNTVAGQPFLYEGDMNAYCSGEQSVLSRATL